MENEKSLVIQPTEETRINVFSCREDFELGQRMAKVFAESTLVPKQYQNNIGNCMIGLNMASRMGADPLMVFQNLVIVHNVPTFEAKFAIACFNATGKYSAIKYKEVGEKGKDSWGMVAYAIEKSTGELCEGPAVTIATAKAEGWYAQNPKWKNTPELMLRYRAASWFIRTTDPGVMMGFQTKEEMEDADYVELPNDAQPIVPQDANTETLDMTQEPAKENNVAPQAEGTAEQTEGAAPKEPSTQEPAKEADEAKTQEPENKPMGKQKTPSIFGGEQ